jgi:hypothetical protein
MRSSARFIRRGKHPVLLDCMSLERGTRELRLVAQCVVRVRPESLQRFVKNFTLLIGLGKLSSPCRGMFKTRVNQERVLPAPAIFARVVEH